MLWNLLVKLDKYINFKLGGSNNETISERAFRAKHKGKLFGTIVFYIIVFFDRNHFKRYKLDK